MRKIAVIFPGVGYTKDRPLLYYSGKLAAQYGYELKFIDFSGIKWSKEQLKDNDFLLRTLDKCLQITEDTLADTEDLSGDDDPMADYSALERIAGEKRLEIHRISGGNHSLETGDLLTDIDNLKAMIQRVDELIG